jgi:hypothetical protein
MVTKEKILSLLTVEVDACPPNQPFPLKGLPLVVMGYESAHTSRTHKLPFYPTLLRPALDIRIATDFWRQGKPRRKSSFTSSESSIKHTYVGLGLRTVRGTSFCQLVKTHPLFKSEWVWTYRDRKKWATIVATDSSSAPSVNSAKTKRYPKGITKKLTKTDMHELIISMRTHAVGWFTS